MRTDESAITAAIRAGTIQQVQVEPQHQRGGTQPASTTGSRGTARSAGSTARG